MKGILKSGKIINGRLAEIFVSRGIAREIKEEVTEQTIEEVTDETKEVKEQPKRVRRTKAQIEQSKKRK